MRRLTRRAEDKYLRNMIKYDTAINKLYRCKCHQEMNASYEKVKSKSKSKLLNILRNTHPDRRDGNEDLRPEFHSAIDELRRRNRTDHEGRTVRCAECEIQRQMAERFVTNIENVLEGAAEPLDPHNFIASIHYEHYYDKVLKADAERYMDGDLSLFGDIRGLCHL